MMVQGKKLCNAAVWQGGRQVMTDDETDVPLVEKWRNLQVM
jgi:hypothetical protein